MRHRVKKTKFGLGKDANKMLTKKLIYNFFEHGYLTTTATKAKYIKSEIERLVEKLKTRNEPNKNYLLRYIPHIKIIDRLYKDVGPAVAKVTGGYVRVKRLYQRDSDGSMISKVTWAYPVVKDPLSHKASEGKPTIPPKSK